jgi:hypothetical protein
MVHDSLVWVHVSFISERMGFLDLDLDLDLDLSSRHNEARHGLWTEHPGILSPRPDCDFYL